MNAKEFRQRWDEWLAESARQACRPVPIPVSAKMWRGIYRDMWPVGRRVELSDGDAKVVADVESIHEFFQWWVSQKAADRWPVVTPRRWRIEDGFTWM